MCADVNVRTHRKLNGPNACIYRHRWRAVLLAGIFIQFIRRFFVQPISWL